jgi:hypothetical protein
MKNKFTMRAIADQAVRRALVQALDTVMTSGALLQPQAPINSGLRIYLAAVKRQVASMKAHSP